MVIDFVPNHMSAHPQWNKWWRSVLANGPSSPVSEYFDVDWYPVNSNLHGKVLLAILGSQYGDVLESGDLSIGYHEGEFCLLYGDYNLPLNPRQIKLLLRHRWDESAALPTLTCHAAGIRKHFVSSGPYSRLSAGRPEGAHRSGARDRYRHSSANATDPVKVQR